MYYTHRLSNKFYSEDKFGMHAIWNMFAFKLPFVAPDNTGNCCIWKKTPPKLILNQILQSLVGSYHSIQLRYRFEILRLKRFGNC